MAEAPSGTVTLLFSDIEGSTRLLQRTGESYVDLLAEHEWPVGAEIRVRMGLHTGEPRFVEGRYVGLDVHHAARVMAAGHGGQVLVSESTRALLDERFRLRDLGEHRLKDLSGPQHLYQLELDGLPSEF